VHLTGTGWLNVFAGALFSLVGVAMGVVIVKQVMHAAAAQNALRQSGRESLGEVTDKWIGGRGQAPYNINYTFSVDGTFHTGKSETPSDTWKSLHQYDSLPIRYLPTNPNVNHPAAWEGPTYSALGTLFYPAFFVVLGFMFVRRFPSQRRFAADGVAVRGCVTVCSGPGRSGSFGLTYTFRNVSNNELESGRCASDSSCEIGSDVWVLYEPSDSSRSEIYPFGIAFFRIDH
jgi:hypothetical protein